MDTTPQNAASIVLKLRELKKSNNLANLKDVVVPVPVRVGAKAVVLDVPSLTLRGVVQPVGRVEMNLTSDHDRALERAHAGCGGFLFGGFLRHGRFIR